MTQPPNQDTEAFAFDPSYIDVMYGEISEMGVDLDDDPIRFGPKRVNGKVAYCKRLVSRCTEIEISLSRDLTNLNRKLRAAQARLDLSVQDLLTSDPEVRAGRSVKDREAIANTKLRSETGLVRKIEQAVEEVKSAITVVRCKKGDLKDTQGRLRDQIRLIGEEVSLGAMWGSSPPPDQTVKPVQSWQGPSSSSSGSLVESVVGDVDELAGILDDEEKFDPTTESDSDEKDPNSLEPEIDGPDYGLCDDEDADEDEDELGTMLVGAATDEKADSALDAIKEAPSNGGSKKVSVVGLNDDDLEGLLSEDW